MTARELVKFEVFMELARGLARLSTCIRSQVGCVIVQPDLSEVLGIGYNGTPAKSPNGSCRGTPGTCGCIHAEANALVKTRSRDSNLILITTLSPCEHCAGLIVNSGRIGKVVYDACYRAGNQAEGILSAAGVELIEWSLVNEKTHPEDRSGLENG